MIASSIPLLSLLLATRASPVFMPHGFCYRWDPTVLWLNVVSDTLIALSYYCIPVVLIYFIRRNRSLPLNAVFWMFATFILACGTTHVLEVWNIWHANYLVAGLLKGITAVVSVATAVMVIPLAPKLIAVPERMQLQDTNRNLRDEIAQRIKVEHALRVAQDSMSSIVASAMDCIITIDEQHNILLFNAAAEKMFRCPAGEVLGQPIERFIPQRFRAAHPAHIKQFGKTGVTSRAMGELSALWALRADGEEFQIEASISQMESAGQTMFTVILRDISERQRADKAARANLATANAALKELADQKFALDQHAIVAVTDVRGTITYVNDKFCTISKYSREALIGQNHRILNSSHHSSEFFQQMYRAIAKGEVWHGEIKNRANGGSFYWVDTTIVPFMSADGKPQQYVAIRADISERKRAEEALRDSERRLTGILDSATDSIITIDENQHIILFNAAAEKMFRCRAAEAMGQAVTRFIPKRFHAAHAGHIKSFSETGVSARAMGAMDALWARRTDGEEFQIEASISQVEAAGKKLFTVILRDVSERVQAAEVRERLAAVVDSSDDAIISKDLNGVITAWNRGAEKIFGYSPAEAVGNPLSILFPPERVAEDHEILAHIRCGESVKNFDTVRVRKDGTKIDVSVTISPVRDSTGAIVGASKIARDISYRKEAEERLRESEERFQSMVNGIPQLAWMAEPDGHIFWYNQRWFDYTGTTQKQMEGWGWQSVHDPKVLPRVMERWKGSIASGTQFEMEFPLRAADGHFGTFLTRITPLKDAQGHVLRWFGTNTDISDRKHAEERRAELALELAHRAEEVARSREALEAQTVMFKQVLESMGEGLIAADREGHFLIWNHAANKLMGREPVDIPTEQWTPHYEVFLPDGVTPYPADQLPLVRALRGESVQVELVVQLPQPECRTTMEVTARPIKDARGNLSGGVAVLRDITERKRADSAMARQAAEIEASQQALQTQANLLQSVLDNMGEGLVAANEHGEFFLWNPAAEKIVGLGPASMPTEQWTEHYGTFLPDMTTPLPPGENPLARAIKGEISGAVLYVRNPKVPQGAWVEANARPLRDANGVLRGGVVAFRDISERKAAEEEILKLNRTLERRVEERTTQLRGANEELEAFTYSVSHDLRAPLRHIAGFTALLLEESSSQLDADAQHHLHRIQDGTRKMGQLVDELLSLARIGRQVTNLQLTGIDSIVEEITAMLRPDWEGRAVEWKISALPPMVCDPTLMKQVFQNLLSNALKYSRTRKPAVIEVGTTQMNGETVIFVRDNGVGFNMKYSDKLFGVFQRLHRADEFEGTGVGLAIVHRIIKKHGGRVWAEAEPDKGATFYFTVGAAATSADNKSSAAGGAGA